MQLQWDSIAPGANWQSKHEVVKNFMSQYSGAAIFFLIDKIPTGVALAKVRLFSSGTFHTLYSINIFQFLQDDVLGDAYELLIAGGGTRGLFLLSQHAEQCRNLVKE